MSKLQAGTRVKDPEGYLGTIESVTLNDPIKYLVRWDGGERGTTSWHRAEDLEVLAAASRRSTYEIKASFGCRIQGRTERRDGTAYDWAYDVIPFAPPEFNIAVYREDEGIIRELHLLDGRGKWSGPSVTVYLPEVGYDRARRDEAGPYAVKPAYCGASATGSTTTDGIRAQARMLEIAAEYADALTAESRQRLQVEADLANADWSRERGERERLGVLRRERQERRAEVLRQAQDHVVRVKPGEGAATWRVGTLRVADDAHGITVLSGGGEHEFSLGHDREPCVEVKQPNGRYAPLMRGDLEVVA